MQVRDTENDRISRNMQIIQTEHFSLNEKPMKADEKAV